ncbi:MAG: hypothetical protein ACRDHP_05400, partial [Ktedonobacterales bacterium]
LYEATAQVVVMVHVGTSITPIHLTLTEKLARQYATQALPEVVVDGIHQAIPARTPESIRSELTVSAVAGQSLIDISARDASPTVALDMSNSAALAFVNYYAQQSFAAEAALAKQETALQTQLQQVNGKIGATQTALAAAKAQGSDTTALQQQLASLQAQQSQVSQQLATVTKQRGALLADFWVASQATEAQRLTADPKVNAVFGAVAGLFAGICAALLLDLLDGIVRRPSDTMRFAGLSTLESVRAVSGDEDLPAPVRQEEYATVAGSYEALRRSLTFLGATRSLQMLLVAPADASSGMDQVGVNLAITCALAGVRTLLVDANWDHPTLTARLGFPTTNQGLFTSLVAVADNPTTPFDAIVPTPIANLFALPVGPLPPNLEDLVQSSLLDQFSSALMTEFEQIVVLAPTHLRDTVGRHLTERMDGALVVARAGATTGRELADVAQSLRRANAYMAGAVLLTQSQERLPVSAATLRDVLPPSGPASERPITVPGATPDPPNSPAFDASFSRNGLPGNSIP